MYRLRLFDDGFGNNLFSRIVIRISKMTARNPSERWMNEMVLGKQYMNDFP